MSPRKRSNHDSVITKIRNLGRAHTSRPDHSAPWLQATNDGYHLQQELPSMRHPLCMLTALITLTTSHMQNEENTHFCRVEEQYTTAITWKS